MDKNELLNEWVNHYADYLLQWAIFRTGRKEEAEDLVQETFIAAQKGFDQFKRESSPKTWLVSILKNKITDFYRKSSKQVLSQFSDSEADSIILDQFDNYSNWKVNQRPKVWTSEPDSLLDNADFLRILKFCQSDLPLNYNLVLSLKYLEDKSAEEICQELDITSSNYWQLIHRAKLKLKKCLEIRWFKT